MILPSILADTYRLSSVDRFTFMKIFLLAQSEIRFGLQNFIIQVQPVPLNATIKYDTTINISSHIRIAFCQSLSLPRNYSISASINFTSVSLLITMFGLYWAHALFCLLFLICCQWTLTEKQTIKVSSFSATRKLM